MALKLINLGPKWTRVTLVSVGLLSVILAWYFIRWNLGNVIASQIDPQRPEAPLIADWLTGFAPDDPQAHLLAGTVFERTFEPGDLERALFEYETAAALSPNNYLNWLSLGKVRSLYGDTEGSFAAYRRALDLAPNYAIVHWVFGNALVRDGQTSEGFAMIAKAAAANPVYLRPAIDTALQIFEGEIGQVLGALGDTEQINAGLAAALGAAKRFDEAYEAWNRLPAEAKLNEYEDLGESLAGSFIEAGKFRSAIGVRADLTEEPKPAIGSVTNGGFESQIKSRDARVFDWNISDGSHPQIGLSDGTKRTGQYSLLLLFNSLESANMRTIDQVVAVEPGGAYDLGLFYRSDIKSAAILRWEVIDAISSTRVGVSAPLSPAAEWTSVTIPFKAPEAADAVRIRLIREGCNGPVCQMNGRISFDDISLRKQ
jgi:tetratricopeptide (TPR) repeat protein